MLCSLVIKALFLGYDLDWNVSNSLILTEIARQPNSLLFLLAWICYADTIKLIGAQRNNSMHYPKSVVALD